MIPPSWAQLPELSERYDDGVLYDEEVRWHDRRAVAEESQNQPVLQRVSIMRFMTAIGFVAVVLPLGILQATGCSGKVHTKGGDEQVASETNNQQQRWHHVVAHHGEVQSGMSSVDVEGLLGKPDQIHPLFAPQIYNPDRIGTSWFYMQTPLPGDERGTSEIVVRFDREGRVQRVDTWGLDKPDAGG